MNKYESKYFNTARLMDEALLLLLDKKEYAYITVKEVCEKAGVNRSTFYLHYETMNDLLRESLDYMFGELRERYKDKGLFEPENDMFYFTPEYSTPYLNFIKDNKKAFMAAVTQPDVFDVDNMFDKLFKSFYDPALAHYNVPQRERMYMMRYYLSGIHAIIIEWIKGGCNDDVQFIADLIVKCVNA